MATDFHITNLSTAGLSIYTTLDLPLQNEAQIVIQHYINGTPNKQQYPGQQPARTARRGTRLHPPVVSRIAIRGHSPLL